jgi:hypothetical protein
MVQDSGGGGDLGSWRLIPASAMTLKEKNK